MDFENSSCRVRQDRKIQSVVYHPNYEKNEYFDIGLAKVDCQFCLNDFVNTVKLPENDILQKDSNLGLISWACINSVEYNHVHDILPQLIKSNLSCSPLSKVENHCLKIDKVDENKFLYCSVITYLFTFSKGQSGHGIISVENSGNHLEAIIIKKFPSKVTCNQINARGLFLCIYPMKDFIEEYMSQ